MNSLNDLNTISNYSLIHDECKSTSYGSPADTSDYQSVAFEDDNQELIKMRLNQMFEPFLIEDTKLVETDGEDSDYDEESTTTTRHVLNRKGSDECYLANDFDFFPVDTSSSQGSYRRLYHRRESRDHDYVVGLVRERSDVSEYFQSFSLEKRKQLSTTETNVNNIELEAVPLQLVTQQEGVVPICSDSIDRERSFNITPPCIDSYVQNMSAAVEEQVAVQIGERMPAMEEPEASSSDSSLPSTVFDFSIAFNASAAVTKQVPDNGDDLSLLEKFDFFSSQSCVVIPIPSLPETVAVNKQAPDQVILTMEESSLPVSVVDFLNTASELATDKETLAIELLNPLYSQTPPVCLYSVSELTNRLSPAMDEVIVPVGKLDVFSSSTSLPICEINISESTAALQSVEQSDCFSSSSTLPICEIDFADSAVIEVTDRVILPTEELNLIQKGTPMKLSDDICTTAALQSVEQSDCFSSLSSLPICEINISDSNYEFHTSKLRSPMKQSDLFSSSSSLPVCEVNLVSNQTMEELSLLNSKSSFPQENTSMDQLEVFSLASTLPICIVDIPTSPHEMYEDVTILSCDKSIITSPRELKTQYDYERFGSMMLADGWVSDTEGENSDLSDEDDILLLEIPLSDHGDYRSPIRSESFCRRPVLIEIPLSPCQYHHFTELPITPIGSQYGRQLIPSIMELPMSPSGSDIKLTKESLLQNERMSTCNSQLHCKRYASILLAEGWIESLCDSVERESCQSKTDVDIHILSCNASDIITSPMALKTQYDYERFGSMILANGWASDTDGEDSNSSTEDDLLQLLEIPVSDFNEISPVRSRAFYGNPVMIEIPLSPCEDYCIAELPISPTPFKIPSVELGYCPVELPLTPSPRRNSQSLNQNFSSSPRRDGLSPALCYNTQLMPTPLEDSRHEISSLVTDICIQSPDDVFYSFDLSPPVQTSPTGSGESHELLIQKTYAAESFKSYNSSCSES